MLFSRVWSQADALKRLFFKFPDLQTVQEHPIRGTPVEVPQPKIVRIIMVFEGLAPFVLTRFAEFG